ncbi:MAG: hypothetical protein PVSMB7_17390 [Chloroflexota bacterium]
MVRKRLSTVRGQLVLWYLSVLAVLLVVLGIIQSLTLSDYLRTTTATSLRQAAFSEVRVLGPCFIQSRADLNRHAQELSQFLGSIEVAVKIVTPTGETLADHGFGVPGRSRSLQLPAATIRRLIATARPAGSALTGKVSSRLCKHVTAADIDLFRRLVRPLNRVVVDQGDLILLAVPLGPLGHALGYALIGRSMAAADATIRRTELVFALGAAVALLLAGIVALPLINRALRPLRRIAGTAGAIASGDLQQRANLAHSPDEIGRLGNAFDTMVDRLQEALTAAHESEERMRRFLADASHELRTPLTVVRGTSEVLLRQSVGERPEIVSALQGMNEEAVRLSRLVDNLLVLTRLDAGQLLDPREVEVRSFLEDFRGRYGGVWPGRQIALEDEALDGATAFVDEEALRRIITNLVDNAARYSAPGKSIVLSGSTAPGWVSVTVRDHGPGLTPQDAERAFERFYRGERSRSSAGGGSGLGLAIVQALALQSGGDVRVTTSPNSGTTVTVSLPRSVQAA